MKKIFLSLLVVFMVLSLSVVLVKAEGETSVALTDGVQIRTDGNNGLRWEAKVENAAEGQVYGFLFAQGELTAEQLNKDTANVVAKEVEGLKEDGTYHATMINFPKSAAVQDITVRAYVKTGEVYTYSENVVTRNLSEVAVEAYEKGTEGDFVKAVYDASETTFNLNGGELYFSSYSMSDYNHFYSVNGVMLHGKGRCASSGSAAWVGDYDRIFMKYDSELEAYRVVATNATGWNHAGYDTQDYDLVLMNSDGATDSKFVEKLADDENVNEFIFKIESSVELNYAIADKNIAANITIKVYENEEIYNLLLSGKKHFGGGATLPTPVKTYYDFEGWCSKEDLSDDAVKYQGPDRVLYAKYSPTNYTISYVLGAGTWVSGYEAPSSFNYESLEILLPTSANVSINDGNFIGWYDNSEGTGEPITSIPANSHGNKTFYAMWQMNEPTVVELSDYEKTIISKYNPNKFVSSDFTNGKFNIDNVIYDVEDGNLYTSLDAALAASSDNDVIYLLGESFTLGTAITKKVTILGPNADLVASAVRSTEAEITVTAGVTNVASAYIEFNGVKLRGSAPATEAGVYFQSKSVAEEFTVKSSVITRMNTAFKLQAGNGIILTIKDCNISNIGQFTVWVTAGMEKTSIISNIFDGSSCGGVASPYATQFRVRNGNLEAYDNQFLGEIQNNPGYFEVTGGGSGVVKYNTFKGVTKFNYTSVTNSITYNENLYLDSEGNVLSTVPSTVSAGSATADTKVASSEENRAARYAAFLNGEEFEEEVVEYVAKLYTNGYALGEGYTLSTLPTSTDTTLNFHKGGYWESVDSVYVNHPYVLFYETSSSLTGFNYAYKVGLNYDEDLEMYYVNQVITNSNIALDATNLLSQYFLIINTTGCADGFDWAKTLVVGDYLGFSSDITAVSSTKGEGTELTAKVYTGYEKHYLTSSNESTITLPVLERFGYKFGGWYTSSDFSGEPITEYTYAATQTECKFYAKWTECVLTANMVMSNSANSTTADHSLSADGLTLTYAYVYVSGTNSFVVFQVYVDGVATSMTNKWTVTYSNTSVLTSWSNYSAMAAIKGAGTCTVTLTYNADPSIKVSFTATLVEGSAA